MTYPEDIYVCQTRNCNYIYDPDWSNKEGKILPGIPFAALPEDWRCPRCGAGKEMFRPFKGSRLVV